MGKNIVLIGLMGSGKTTIGKLLKLKLHMELIDVDSMIEKETNQTISEIFGQYGESFFRKLEVHAINKISTYSDKIISTGGGVVENPQNIENLKKNGVLFYLHAPAKELFDRIKNDKHRPLLQHGHPLSTLESLLKKREKYYKQADFIIETVNRPSNEIVDEIIESYKNNE